MRHMGVYSILAMMSMLVLVSLCVMAVTTWKRLERARKVDVGLSMSGLLLLNVGFVAHVTALQYVGLGTVAASCFAALFRPGDEEEHE